MQNFLTDILQRWCYFEHLVSVEQLAEWAEVKPKTMYSYIEGERDMPFRRVRRIARAMSLYKGRNDIAESLLAHQFEVTIQGGAQVNGAVDDDIAPMVEDIGRLRRAFLDGDRMSYEDALRNLEGHLRDLKGEGRQL